MFKTTIIVSLALFSVVAHSESVGELDELWKFLDTNIDGSISKAEAASYKEILENWNILDTNADDKLNKDELAKYFDK